MDISISTKEKAKKINQIKARSYIFPLVFLMISKLEKMITEAILGCDNLCYRLHSIYNENVNNPT